MGSLAAPGSRDVTAIGEVMLRLSVPAGVRLEDAARLDVHPAGAEYNALTALARLNRGCLLVTALPETAPGRLVLNRLRASGMQTEGLIWCETGRIGTYFVEFAAPPRPIDVIYDRAGSCITQLSVDQIDWDSLLDTRLLLLSGITPALAPGCEAIVRTALDKARRAGVPVAFDVNYRGKLWPPEAAAKVISELARDVEILFCKQADAALLFGVHGGAEHILSALSARTGARHVVLTAGERGVYGWDGSRAHHVEALPVTVLDRLGAGDALAAGVIHGWLDGDFLQGLRYGVTLAALAMSQYGDALITTRAELERLSSALAAPDILR